MKHNSQTTVATALTLFTITGTLIASQANAWTDLTDGLGGFLKKQIFGTVEVSVSYAPDGCPAERPIAVSIENTTGNDITELELTIYAFRENSSRVECTEGTHFRDEIFRSGDTAEWCMSTVLSAPWEINDQIISAEMMDYYDELISGTFAGLPYNFARKFGEDASFVGDYLNGYALQHDRRAGDLNPKQSIGCRKIEDDFQWAARIDGYETFDGFK